MVGIENKSSIYLYSHRWNGPNQASQLKNKTNSSNQPKELEMETFLQKDRPMENGEAEEYTVIQLDDLAEKYSSD